MLNRTNLTLSALSNRLNLGTRSLVINASVNNLGQALTVRPSFHDHHVMREGTMWDVDRYSCALSDGISPRPGSMISIPRPEQQPVGCFGTWEVEPAFVGRVATDLELNGPLGLLGLGWQGDACSSSKSTASKAGPKTLKRQAGRKPRPEGEASECFAASPAKAPIAAAATAAAATA